LGSFYKRVSFFFIYIIFLLVLLNNFNLFAQETDSIYIETITISLDSQELLKLEQDIEEIPIDYSLLNITENFLTSYEQLSLNVVQFKYNQNFYFSNLLYSTLSGYSALLYYSSNFGSSFFQGFSLIEVYNYLPILGFHFFKNNFELEKKFIYWSINYNFYFESFNLPGLDGLNSFSSIFLKQELKGKKNNFDFYISLNTLSFNPTYQFYICENLHLNYLIIFTNSIYSKISIIQLYGNGLGLKPQFSIIYNFSDLEMAFGASYDLFLNKVNGFFNLFYRNENTQFYLKVEKDNYFELLDDKYTIISKDNFNLNKDFIYSEIGFKFISNTFSISTKIQYDYFWNKPLKIYYELEKIFYLTNIEDVWNIYLYTDFDWKINSIFGINLIFELNLPSYYLKNYQIMKSIIDKFLTINIIGNINLTEDSSLNFILYSDIIRKFLGENNPTCNFQIEYNISKNDFEISFLLTLNILNYYILPSIESRILNLSVNSQIYF